MSPALAPLFLLAVGPAHGLEPYSLDIELIRPSFAWGSFAGVPYPHELRPGDLCMGAMLQYERDPLVLISSEVELGAMVGERGTLHLGAGYDWERAQLGVDLPLAVQDSGDLLESSAAGFGVGDPRFSVGVPLIRGPIGIAAAGAVLLPFGTQQAYLGEPEPRAELGAAFRLRDGGMELMGDVGVVLRERLVYEENLEVAHELRYDVVGMLDMMPGRSALMFGLLSRRGLGDRWMKNQNLAAELVTGARYATDRWALDLGVGRSVWQGYGGTEFRAHLGFIARGRPGSQAQPERISVPVEPEPEREVLTERVEEEVRLSWRPAELARVTRSEIEIREPIQFRYNTDEVLPVSLPTLRAVAGLLLTHPELRLIAVEGHASEEGSFRYNYDLSNRRAHAVVVELVRAGVHPSRISLRGMGEVVPVDLGLDEASLARNRRVVFHIVERADPLDPVPEPERSLVPWSGDPIATPEVQP